MSTTYPSPSPDYIGPANRHGGSNNKPVDRIVIHATVSACAVGARSIAEYFKRTSKPASAHYVVDQKEPIQALFDSYVGYHAPPNTHSLGIELCCTLAGQGKGHWKRRDHQKMLRNAAKLTAQLCLHYDVPVVHLDGADLRAGKRGIAGHADVRDGWHQTTHWDPGPYFPWADFLRMVREEVAKIQQPVTPAVPAAPSPSKPTTPAVPAGPTEVEEINTLLDLVDAKLGRAVQNGRTGYVAKFRAQLRTIRPILPKH